MKGILVKKWELDWCIIKEGKAEMWADPFGRTIGDRIKWQYQVQKQLQHAVTVPKVVKLFTHNRDVYFVMDYIEGVKLSDAVFSLLDRKSWFSVSFDQKEQLLSYLQKIVCIVKAMHGLGIINRDLNSDNFIVQKDRTIYLIDLELSYSTKEKYPTPPFLLGTPGFMSLEQQRRLVPTVKEDVFGLGALCIVFLTGINPTKFSEIEESMIADHLNYFLRDRELAEFVAMCLKPIRKQRPEVEDIHIFIKRKAKMIHEGNDTGLIPEPISTGSYRHLIDQLLKSYTERPLIDENGLWLSKLKQGSSSVGNEVTEGKPYLDWGEGISGILFTLAKVKASGIDISMLEKSISVNAGFVMEETKKLLTHLEAGLFYHSSGIAFSVTHLLNEKLIQDSYKCREVIKNCLCIRPTALNLEIGLAGHGLSLLHCRPYLDNYALQNDLEHCIKRLLDTQRKEGYWIIKQPHDPKGTPFLGFTNGSAGILYFLIECNHLFHNGRVEQAIINGLDCMENSMVKENGVNFWPISYRSREAYPWLAFGFPGIVVTFIKAFERTGIEKVLEGFPIYLVHNNLSFHFGLPGIGELYLEAKRVFQTDKYDQRINWIAGALLNTSLSQPSESVFWLTNETTIPFGDFLTGNAGVLHFFTRYVNPKIKFPFSL
jgi:serine/threonine protein kinase